MSDEKYTNFFDHNESNHEEFDKSDVINREDDGDDITNPFETDFNKVPLEEEKPVSDVKPLLTQEDLDLIINNQSVSFMYIDVTKGWQITSTNQ